ncbi:hypothetical protein Tco_1538376 [Tanacetum coccineum]
MDSLRKRLVADLHLSSYIPAVASIVLGLALARNDSLCEKFHIPDVGHPELPAHNDRIHNSPIGKISLFVIAAARVYHLEILCHVHGFVPTVEMDLFAFINHADPTKGNVNVQGAGNDDVNEEDGDVAEADQT